MTPVRLSNYAADTYSQFGDDGMIAEVFRRIGEGAKCCVEFGAADGLSCSNTAVLRQAGWRSLLLESDGASYAKLIANLKREADDQARAVWATVTGENIDTFLDMYGFLEPDCLSIDVDGDDYFIFAGLRARPRLVIIEFNCTVPPHIDIRQAAPGGSLGASALSLVRLARKKRYHVIGMNRANLYLVPEPVHPALLEFESRLTVLMEDRRWTTIISDQTGRSMILDPAASLEWGIEGSAGIDGDDHRYIKPGTGQYLISQINPRDMPRYSMLWGFGHFLDVVPGSVVREPDGQEWNS